MRYRILSTEITLWVGNKIIKRRIDIMSKNNGTYVILGTTIKDRNDKEYTVYSALLKDCSIAAKLLHKIDPIMTVNNVISEEGSEESYDAVLEISRLALREKYTKEEINEFIDAEMARKIIRIYLDLPLDIH